MEDITAIGLVLLIVGMGAKGLIDWFKQRNLQDSESRLKAVENGLKTLTSDLKTHDESHATANERIKELHEWHDRKDSDGVPVWYVRKSLEEIIKQNADAVTMLAQQSTMQTQVLKELSENQKDMLIKMRRLHVQPVAPVTQ